jgi:hypothetical protein
MAVQVFEEMAKLLDTGHHLDADTTSATIDIVQSDRHPSPAEVLGDEALTHRGRAIRAKSVGQKRYLDAIRDHTVVFGIGPAGTGKTYLAMAMAVLALKRKEVNRIILTRPAVEAGERLAPPIPIFMDYLHYGVGRMELLAQMNDQLADYDDVEVRLSRFRRMSSFGVAHPLAIEGWGLTFHDVRTGVPRSGGDRCAGDVHRSSQLPMVLEFGTTVGDYGMDMVL